MSEHTSVEEKRKRRTKAYTISTTVFIVLSVITVVEYLVSLIPGIGESAIIMFLIGLAKAYAIVVYFMHIARLWSPEGAH
ncbi:MAG: cytochrome C oxidase subunit IV family protein [Chloroflexota bacterium]